ncbi:uncharacterized protein [Chironomus tepperi]|uniref:uncharacterized protein n=1 Tax=Chironomus tepperi TaxID=113505 RepID=UPI00391FA3BB
MKNSENKFHMSEQKNDVENQLLQSEEKKLEKMRQEKYFIYKNDLKNYEYKESNGNSIIFKNYPNIFLKKSYENRKELSEFEKILTSNEDNSAIISMVLRKFENEDFLTNKIDLTFVMGKHFAHEAHIMNLFSFLMFDWHDQSVHNRSYNLIQKFKAYKYVSSSTKSLFDKIFQIMNAEDHNIYHVICMKIIFYYFEEKNVFSGVKKPEEVMSETKNIQDLIRKVVQIKDSEYKIQILKILYANLPNTKDTEYKSLIDKIKQAVKFDFHYSSVCKISYEAITKHCDERFFNLLYFLKENLVAKFKLNFEEFIKINKKFYGDFWKNAIKTNVRILYHTANNQNLTDTKEFILINTPNINIKAKVSSIFMELSEFYTIFNEPLEKEDEFKLEYLDKFIMNFSNSMESENFKKYLKNIPNIRKLLFGRKTLDSHSIFEKFWSVQSDLEKSEDYFECSQHIWNEFRLWEKPEMLTMKNPLNRRIFDYVLSSNNDWRFMEFLMPTLDKDTALNNSTQKLKHYMVLKNSLIYDHHNYLNARSLIEFHLNLIDRYNDLDSLNLDKLFYMFEEIGFYSSEQSVRNSYIEELFEVIKNEKPQKFDGKNELGLPRKHFLLGILMIYWKQEAAYLTRDLTDKFYMDPKTSESNDTRQRNLYFGLLSLVMNKNEAKFLEIFPKEMEIAEDCFKLIYGLDSNYNNEHQLSDENNIFHFYEKYSTNFNFVLLYAAIKTNQTVIVDEIFKYNNFLISCPTFPINMEPDEIHYHTAVKFLENRYELERNDLPVNWIRNHNFKKFLDSRLSSQDNFYKIDCRFMLPYYNFEENKIIDQHMENDEDLLFNEDYGSMEYILDHHGLKSLVTHPVMETIINLKIQKYDRILFWNFFGFVLFYIVPTIFLAYRLHSINLPPNTNVSCFLDNLTFKTISSDEFLNNRWDPNNGTYVGNVTNVEAGNFFYYLSSRSMRFFWEYVINTARLLYICLREFFQYRVIYKDRYFKMSSNLVEIFLIFIPLLLYITLAVFSVLPCQGPFYVVGFIEAVNILVMIVATSLLYSTPKFSAHLRCYKKIILSYMSVFINFFPLFIGLAGLTLIIFDDNLGGTFEDFQNLGGSIMKLIIMYSGEIGIEQAKISLFLQRVTIALIIIMLINKSNLIISIAVNDIQSLMHESRLMSLVDNARKYVGFAKRLRTYYALNEKEEERTRQTKCLMWIIKVFIDNYPYIHRLQTIYIDKQTHDVYVDVNTPIQKLAHNTCFLTRWTYKIWIKTFGTFKIDSKSIEEIHNILVETRCRTNCLCKCQMESCEGLGKSGKLS